MPPGDARVKQDRRGREAGIYGRDSEMSENILIGGVLERDIDLLLLEEFLSCPYFQQWFVSKISDVDLGKCVWASRSVTHATGESDLEVVFEDESKCRTRLLIENKVAASLQPQQAERYSLRARSYMAREDCGRSLTVLCAPSRYFGNSQSCKGFDSRITHEAILDWFRDARHLGPRRLYKMALLESAIVKGTLGYQPREDAAVTAFWKWYWRLSQDVAPELEMREPGGKAAGSAFVIFHPASLPKGMEIVHKLTRGYVDLQVAGAGRWMNEISSTIGQCLAKDMKVVRVSSSSAVRINVAKLDTNAPGEPQREAALEGLAAALKLLDWHEEHGGKISRFLKQQTDSA